MDQVVDSKNTCLLQAAQAVLAGVCVDLFAVTNEYTDLASLKYLSIESGGGLLLYSSTEEATLPQDLCVRILFLLRPRK